MQQTRPLGAADRPFRLLIVGGGTAGWMAACLAAKHWADRQVEITLVESPEIGIIGVGEGSTPQMRALFRYLGVTDAEWMPRCNATYKNGISFHGWSAQPGCDSYFHPFPSPIDAHTTPAFHLHNFARRRGADLPTRPDRFFLSAKLAERRLAPLPAENFPFDIAYGYHFDAHLVGQFLRSWAEARGVRCVQARIRKVALRPDGGIDHLQAADELRLDADFFIDATGFRSLLLQEAMGVPFRSFSDNLYNDSAVVTPTPLNGPEIPSATRAIAMRHGWRWEIPLTSRFGNGYVFSSAFVSPDEAERELRDALGIADSEPGLRRLSMRVGRVEEHWRANCLAVGLSQGFLEPLEATALHLVQATLEGFLAAVDASGFAESGIRAFNQRINARFEGVRDYIVCHYKANQRGDTEYWRANRAQSHLSDSLQAVLTCWNTGGDIRQEIRRQDIAKYYTDMSWTCLLGGYGCFPAQVRPPTAEEQVFDMAVIDDFVRRCAHNFRPHHEALRDSAPLQ